MICKDHSDNEALAACPWCLSAYWEMHYLQQKAQLAAAQAREAELVTHVERLREAINRQPYTMDKEVCEALAATPAQSLARVRNQVRDECYNALQKVMVTDHSLRTYKRCLDAIRAMKEPT